MVAPTPLVTGLGGAIGADFRRSRNDLIFVEFNGKVSRLDLATNAYAVLGTGYGQPEDVVASADGVHAFVTERTGSLLRVALTNANRASAAVIVSGLTAPHQIALDEDRGIAHVVEFANPGRLLRIDLATSAVAVVVSSLANAIGLLVTDDGRFAYVTEQLPTGRSRLVRIDLNTSARAELFTSPTATLFFLSWTDASQSGILVPERDPANTVWMVDLTSGSIAPRAVATAVPFRPSSVEMVSPDRIVVCSDSVISEADLTGGLFTAAGPMLLGVGLVPVSRIVGGYADTTKSITLMLP